VGGKNKVKSIAFVTGADRGLGLALTHQLLQKDWQVYAGQYMSAWPELGALAEKYPQHMRIVPLDVSSLDSVRAASEMVAASADHVDLLINNAGVTSPTMKRFISEGLDYAEIQRLYNTNSIGPLRVVEKFLPLVGRSVMKRLCFVSSEAGSIARAKRESWFGYCMSKAALNMAVKLLFNNLRPQGYTFRVYHPGWIRSYMGGQKNNNADLEPEVAAAAALTYFLGEGKIEMEQTVNCDEDQLVMRDWEGSDWPW
jgi:NAD(P)-dependent dehydrogenase (short-subunit alcohol dehydrogenase family)